MNMKNRFKNPFGRKSGSPSCLRKKPINYVHLGFWIPFLSVGLALLFRAFLFTRNPETRFSLLYSDSLFQYFPFFKMLRASILSGEGLLYTWNIGMGMDYLGLIAYYLGSPLNFLSVLVPENLLIEYFTFLQPVRIGLAGLFFALMLEKIFRKNDLSVPLFASFYATCAWVFGYMWNSMWMDTFALLPLVVLGTYELLKNRKFLLYTVSLFLSVAINYYIGLFTCIFTLLVFICYQISCCTNFKRFMTDLGLMAVFTVIALSMTFFITLPTLASLMTTSSSVNYFPTDFSLNIASENTLPGLFDAMKQVATNAFVLIHPNYMEAEGLPNIYCGVVALVLAILFLTCKQIKWRERICCLVLLLFLNISFILRQLDYVWHGFHFTNCIPYRFSFLYSFVLVFMAYKAWLLRHRIRPWQVAFTAAAVLVMFVFSSRFEQSVAYLTDITFQESILILLRNWRFSLQDIKDLVHLLGMDTFFVLANIFLLAMYLIPLAVQSFRKPLLKLKDRTAKQQYFKKLKTRRSVCSVILVCTVAAELLLNVFFFGITVNCANVYDYPEDAEDTAGAIAWLEQQEDELFYRSALAQPYLVNNGALHGFNGLSTFSSSANSAVSHLMDTLGYTARRSANTYKYCENGPISSMFLNLKYVFKAEDDTQNSTFFTDIYQSGAIVLQQNNYYLPLGFMVDPALAELSFDDVGDRFEFQDQLLSAALGEEVSAWNTITTESSDLLIESTANVTLTKETIDDIYSYTSNKSGGNIVYTFTASEAGYFAVYTGMTERNAITVSYDDGSGFTTVYTGTYEMSNIRGVCPVQPGDQVRVTVSCDPDATGKVYILGGIMDISVADYAYEKLSQSTMEITSFENTKIEGTVTCQEDGLMYTSIPQNNGNWRVYVDGEETQPTLIGDVMIGVMLTEGEHTVTFRYQNKAFLIGCVISAVSLCLFLAICWFVYRFPKKYPEKYEKLKAAKEAKKAIPQETQEQQ